VIILSTIEMIRTTSKSFPALVSVPKIIIFILSLSVLIKVLHYYLDVYFHYFLMQYVW